MYSTSILYDGIKLKSFYILVHLLECFGKEKLSQGVEGVECTHSINRDNECVHSIK